MKTLVKQLITILLTCVAVYCLFCIALSLLLSNKIADTILLLFFALLTLTLWLVVRALIWQLWQSKTYRIVTTITASITAALLLAVAGNAAYVAYYGSSTVVSERSVNLALYDPFREDTLAVSLNEPATLHIADKHPRIDGATALYPLYAAFAKAVYSPDYNADDIVTCTSTDGAYKRLINGEADIIFVAGPSSEQLQLAKNAGVELTLTPIGREAFVFFVNAKNPVDGLSIADIQGIYSGQITNWQQLGGKNESIRAFQRPQNSGSQTALLKFMGDIPLMSPPLDDIAFDMGEIIDRVSAYQNYRNAIGYSFLFYATQMVQDDKIKLLAVEGIAPSRENVANNTYPYASEFYAVTAGNANPHVEAFINWILSAQGQYLVEKTGYTPLLIDSGHQKIEKISGGY